MASYASLKMPNYVWIPLKWLRTARNPHTKNSLPAVVNSQPRSRQSPVVRRPRRWASVAVRRAQTSVAVAGVYRLL
ncbi:unnamed protein product [Citrullus colocynthis]|uniref:Uncharacterized protein n=1 Tax=Citrullus colocynthis TaxID=252529 RepID=A0ABP0Z6D0_9ROSI